MTTLWLLVGRRAMAHRHHLREQATMLGMRAAGQLIRRSEAAERDERAADEGGRGERHAVVSSSSKQQQGLRRQILVQVDLTDSA